MKKYKVVKATRQPYKKATLKDGLTEEEALKEVAKRNKNKTLSGNTIIFYEKE